MRQERDKYETNMRRIMCEKFEIETNIRQIRNKSELIKIGSKMVNN